MSYAFKGPWLRPHCRLMAVSRVIHSKHARIQMRNNGQAAVGICLHPNRLNMNGCIRMRSSIIAFNHFLVTLYRAAL